MPAGKGRDEGQGDVVAHGIVSEAPGEASAVERIAHDEVEARPGLPDAVQPFPDAGHDAGRHEPAQIPAVPDAFHADDGQDEALVEPCPGMQERGEHIPRAEHAQHDHSPQAVKQRPHEQTPPYRPRPGMTVVAEEEDGAQRRQHLPRAVADGEARQRQPEGPEQSAIPESGAVVTPEITQRTRRHARKNIDDKVPHRQSTALR